MSMRDRLINGLSGLALVVGFFAIAHLVGVGLRQLLPTLISQSPWQVVEPIVWLAGHATLIIVAILAAAQTKANKRLRVFRQAGYRFWLVGVVVAILAGIITVSLLDASGNDGWPRTLYWGSLACLAGLALSGFVYSLCLQMAPRGRGRGADR